MATTETISRKAQLVALDEECARIMRFKKVCWFLGKLCVQIENDIANNNVPWSPTTNFADAAQILQKYHMALHPYGPDGWCCGTEYTEAHDLDMRVAICKALIAHEKLG